MDRFLLQQMRNEWRGNIWLVLQLSVVALVLWIILSFFSMIIAMRSQDYGYDTNDIVAGSFRIVPGGGSVADYNDWLYERAEEIVTALRNNPYVEMVGIGSNALPYHYNHHGIYVNSVEEDTSRTIYCNRRMMTPDVVRILRLESLDGRSTEELAQVIERGEYIMGDYDPTITDRERIEDFLNKTVIFDNDSTYTGQIGALAHSIHRSDYEPLYTGVIYSPLWHNFPQDLVIRVRPGHTDDFMASVRLSDLKSESVYVTDLESLSARARSAHRDLNTLLRNCSVCAAFLMFVVFLGFLGTFWFRTQQRAPELALRKVCGATRGGLFVRMLTEGSVILCLSLVLAASGAWLLFHYEILNFEILNGHQEAVFYGAFATVALLLLLITAGIWLPARLAMGISPAEALKEQ